MAKEKTTTTKKDEVLTIEGKGRDEIGRDNKGILIMIKVSKFQRLYINYS